MAKKYYAKVILIIGQTGTGKTPYVKTNFFNPYKKISIVYDVENEYYNPSQPLVLPEQFLKQVEKSKDKIIIFEEANRFFSVKADGHPILRALMGGKFHSGNTLIFCFHALRQIPLYLMDYTTLIVLFKTNDTEAALSRKFIGFDNLINKCIENNRVSTGTDGKRVVLKTNDF